MSSHWRKTPTGSIEGLVTDKSGAVVQGASITIVQTTTNESRATVSDASGRYYIPFVDPGTYNITADAKEFDQTGRKIMSLSR